jgi:hypothetical protein
METIQKAMAALGAQYAASLRDVTVTGTATTASGTGSFTWKNSGRKFHYVYSGGSSPMEIASGSNSKPTANVGGKDAPVRNSSLALFPPHLLAFALNARFQDSSYAFVDKGTAIYNGNGLLLVSIWKQGSHYLQTVTRQDWYFDPVTFLPYRIDYVTADDTDPSVTTKCSYTFSGYKSVLGVMVPVAIAAHSEDSPDMLMQIDSLEVNTGLTDSDFVLAGGGQ